MEEQFIVFVKKIFKVHLKDPDFQPEYTSISYERNQKMQ